MKSGPTTSSAGERAQPDGFVSAGADPERIHREWQLTNTLWALTQRSIALVLLLLCLPLFLVLYVPVRMSAKAPFFFRQQRLFDLRIFMECISPGIPRRRALIAFRIFLECALWLCKITEELCPHGQEACLQFLVRWCFPRRVFCQLHT